MLKFIFSFTVLFQTTFVFSQSNLTEFVNPFIGTGGHGHTFPGAVLPFGMVQLSPDTRVDDSWDGASGYHYSDDRIYGFSHTHLSGTGVSDFCDILVMPMTGVPTVKASEYSSRFSHAKEKAQPGFYEVFLEDDKIKAELTVTPRVGIHKYTFSGDSGNVVIDLLHRDKTIDCGMVFIDSVTVFGFRISESWAKKQACYFTMKFSIPYKSKHIANKGAFIERLGKFPIRPENGVFTFDVSDGKPLLVKVAISPVSTKGAEKNLLTEAPHWDFEKYKKEALATWEKQLAKIEINKAAADAKTVFYTALYHSFIHPSLNMDVDGSYRGRDNKIHVAKGFTNYSVFSLWDTYRALHPLYTLLEQKRSNDFINSFLVQYDQSGRLPMWELASNETDCMIGFHAVSVILDAYRKGIRGYDVEKAYQAMKAAASYTGYGIPVFNKKSFLSVDDENESVSKTLEYGYDNWCVGQMALDLGKKQEAGSYLKRSLAYQNMFDASTGFMRPRKNGDWLSPFSPSEINNHFTEANSWQYSFYVPHDINGLITLHETPARFEAKLDELFTTKEKNKGRDQADVTGLIGQYAHGNEPSHHVAYLYNYTGAIAKTIQRVKEIQQNFYKNSPDGLIGNDDCGQLSAWYVFSSMGFYPVCPGSGSYAPGAPQFEDLTVHFENGNKLKVKLSNDVKTPFLQLNGKKLTGSSLDHQELVKGGELMFGMGEKLTADKDQSQNETAARVPATSVTGYTLIAAPLIKAPEQVFKEQLVIKIVPLSTQTGTLRFTTDGNDPSGVSTVYTEPITISANTTLKAAIFTGSDSSSVTQADFYKLKHDAEVRLVSVPDPQYAASGGSTLIDGMPSDVNWRKGNWIGIQGKNLEVIVELKESKNVSALSLHTLQDTRSWILFPAKVEFYGSSNGKKYTLLGTVENDVKADDYQVRLKNFDLNVVSPSLRFIKIVAHNAGKLPEWHLGKGGDSYIFADELEIR